MTIEMEMSKQMAAFQHNVNIQSKKGKQTARNRIASMMLFHPSEA